MCPRPPGSPAARDLITRMLAKNPQMRLGREGADGIKGHAFFAPLNWELLQENRIVPPWQPQVAAADDTSHFDAEFTTMAPADSFVMSGPSLDERDERKFEGFSFVDPEEEERLTDALGAIRV